MPSLESLTAAVEAYGYAAVFICMFFEGMCIPIPSELIMGFAGFLVYQGKFSFAGAFLAGWLGSFSGSFFIYLVARKGGRQYLYRYGHLVRLTPHRLDIIADWFNRYGPPLIVPWRQLPVIRTKISIAAGLLNMRYTTFVLYTAAGIAVWCGLSTYLGFYFGQNWEELIAIFSSLGHFIIIGLLALAFALAAYLYYLRSQRARKNNRD